MDEEEEERPQHKANLNSEFLQHPESGAFFRNPLRGAKAGLLPTLLSAGEYKHNCLDEALRTCPCIKISESGFRHLIGEEAGGLETPSLASTFSGPSTSSSSVTSSTYSTPRSTPNSARSMQRRVPLSKLPEVPVGCDIFVHLSDLPHRGSDHHHHHHNQQHQPGNSSRKEANGGGGLHRRDKRGQQEGTQMMKEMQLENIGIDVNGLESQMQVKFIRDGPVARWNKTHPELQVKVGDYIVRVNGHKRLALDMATELGAASGSVTFVARRPSALSHRGGRTSRVNTPLLPSATS